MLDNNTKNGDWNTQRKLNYQSILPYYIHYDFDLNINHTRIYGIIQQMESHPNPSVIPTFSYSWIATILNINRRNAIKTVKKLIDKGYIEHIQTEKGWVWKTKKSHVLDTEPPTDLPVSENDPSVSERHPPSVSERHPPSVSERHSKDLEVKYQKELKRKNTNAHAREISSVENLDTQKKPSEAGSQSNDNFVDSRPQLSEERSDMPINPDYVYPDTYYGMQDNDVSSVKDVNNGGGIVSSDVLDSFSRFWDLYPRKHGKKAALEVWVKLRCYVIEEDILTKLVDQVERDKIFVEGYAPNPENYLKGRRWEDEIYEIKKRTSAGKADLNMQDTSWARPENRTISEVVERGIWGNEDGWLKSSTDLPERSVKALLNWI